MRSVFLEAHEDEIEKGLETVFGQVKLHKAPLDAAIKKRFMKNFLEMPNCELRPAFHGTNRENHASIFRRGLLIPGDGNELKIAHGAAHGKGIYTANIDAAWLSKSFCSHAEMLVCGVLQSEFVRHVGDAMVVSKADHVVPLFWSENRANIQAAKSPGAPSAVPAVTASKLAAATNTGKAKGKKEPKDDKEIGKDKAYKFKARLAKRSARH